jgi:hypothetical protein
LSSKIIATSKLNSTDKLSLTSEVDNTATGLRSLQTQLDNDGSVADARTTVAEIYSEYRVYALLAPKIGIIKVADDQQQVQMQLSDLANKLQTRLSQASQKGTATMNMQQMLILMQSEIAAAHSISSSIEAQVIDVVPSDYNINHALLSGCNTRLKTAHNDDMKALNMAKTIVSMLAK